MGEIELCKNCARPENQHVWGRCPSLGTHVAIDAKILELIARRGFVQGMAVDLFPGILIDKLTINGELY